MATTAGYHTIPEPKSVVPEGNVVKDKLGAVARGAGEAANGAREAVSELIAGPMPEVNVYTDPLNPTTQLSLRDRISLVFTSCRDWREFADFRAFNLPSASEAKLRLGHNLETFFYNYFVISCVYLAVTGLFNLSSALQLILLGSLAAYFYVIHEDPIVIGNVVRIDTPAKHVIIVGVSAIILLFGHVFSFLLGAAIFTFILVTVHGFFREHAVPSSV